MRGWVVKRIEWPEYWVIDHDNMVVQLLGDTMEELDFRMDETLRKERARKSFDILEEWADKVHPVYGSQRKLVLSIERAGTALFGVTIYSVHLMAYLLKCEQDVWEESKFTIWTALRSKEESFPTHFDNSVCAALCTGEEPWDKILEQTVEDGYFPKRYTEMNIVTVGTVTYFGIHDEQLAGEPGLIQPECIYVYDLRFIPNIPHPNPTRLKNVMMKPINLIELKKHVLRGRFRPQCALVFTDFIIRHGFLNPKNEPDYIGIISRLHRRLEFPHREH